MKLATWTGILAGVLLCTGNALAGPGAWTTEGPYGGRIDKILVNPASPSTLHALTAGGLFRSNDGGTTWARKQAGLTGVVHEGLSLALDVDAPNRLWVVDAFNRLNRSMDGSENWALTGYVAPADDWVADLVDVPGDIGKLYLVLENGGVMYSSDNGTSFTPRNTGLPANSAMHSVAVDPSTPMRLLAGIRVNNDPAHPQKIFRSTDGGLSWTGVFDMVDQYADPEFSFGAAGTVYALVGYKLYRSDDSGANWVGPLLGGQSFETLQASRSSGNTVVLGSPAGLQISTDGGTTATTFNSGLVMTGPVPVRVTTIALHPNYPTTPNLWLGSMDAGVFFSASGGAGWTAQNEGLSATNIRAMAMFHDTSTHRMFAGLGDALSPSPAVYRGNNVGPGTAFSSWTPSNLNLNAYQTRALVIDPTTTSSGIGATRIYAGGRAGNSSADPVVNGGLYRSLDGGTTWSTIDAGLPIVGGNANVGTVRTIVLDPRSCVSPPPSGPCTSGPLQTLYATANGRQISGTWNFRIMRSTNGGNTWENRDNGIPQAVDSGLETQQHLLVVPLVLDPVNPQVLYAGTSSNYRTDTVSTPTIRSGVFKSVDGGANWSFSSTGLPRKHGSTDTALDVLSLAINPLNPNELWCSVIDLYSDTTSGGGIYHSTDGGASWSNSSSGLISVDVRAIHVDPVTPTTLYAAAGGTDGNPGGVFRSSDSGATWTSISVGMPANSASALLLDPVDPNVLYAGTTAGLWSLTQMPDADLDGVPDAIEAAAPGGGDGNNDGIQDYLQADVGSLVSASANPNRGEGDVPQVSEPYFTVAVTPVTGSCSQSVDVQSVYAAYHGADAAPENQRYTYPRQLARFEITQCQKAKVTLKFHGANFNAGYSFRFFGPATPGDPETIGWHDFRTRATQTGRDRWELMLENGQFGSLRPASANSILFEGGPAYDGLGLFNDDFD